MHLFFYLKEYDHWPAVLVNATAGKSRGVPARHIVAEADCKKFNFILISNIKNVRYSYALFLYAVYDIFKRIKEALDS